MLQAPLVAMLHRAEAALQNTSGLAEMVMMQDSTAVIKKGTRLPRLLWAMLVLVQARATT